MNRYQEALDNLYRRSTDPHFYIPMGEDKLWKNTLQKLINEHEKLKEENQKLKDKETPKKVIKENNIYGVNGIIFECPKCGLHLVPTQNYCDKCSQKLDWSDSDE